MRVLQTTQADATAADAAVASARAGDGGGAAGTPCRHGGGSIHAAGGTPSVVG